MEKPKPVFQNMYTYGTVDLAARYRSTAGTQDKPPDEIVHAATAHVERDGFVVLERVIPMDVVEAIRTDVAPRLSDKTGRRRPMAGPPPPRIIGHPRDAETSSSDRFRHL